MKPEEIIGALLAGLVAGFLLGMIELKQPDWGIGRI